jgi:protein-S-isoprenylcysteine O-methyltransferase Ste14
MTAKREQSGVGLKWAVPTAGYFIAAVSAHFVTYPRFVISQVSLAACLVVGAFSVTAGVAMYLAALVYLRKGLRSGGLVTNGLYAIMRHPLYAASILLIIPGVALAFRSWLLLPMPVVAYVACRVVLPVEDDELLKRYGDQFLQYRQRTNALFPTRMQRLHGRNTGPERKD